MKISSILLLSMVLLAPAGLFSAAAFERDGPAELDRAEESLKTARNELQHAGDEWGGHKAKAIEHINAALQELERAEHSVGEHATDWTIGQVAWP